MAFLVRAVLVERLVNRARPLVMGILNITPDSFSDGGRLFVNGKPDLDKVLFYAEGLVDEGADLLDVGGESTRPGADNVSTGNEIERVLPIIEAMRARFDVPLSVDTSTPELITLVSQAGVEMINDIRALCKPRALAAAAAAKVTVCLMHSKGEPKTMQNNPCYEDVNAEVARFLQERVSSCKAAGILPEHIVIDPGFGFGKTFEQNLSLFKALPALTEMGYPVMIGVSRKAMVGAIVDKPVDQRHYGSAALAVLAAQANVSIIRAHDVAATVDSLKIISAIQAVDY